VRKKKERANERGKNARIIGFVWQGTISTGFLCNAPKDCQQESRTAFIAF